MVSSCCILDPVKDCFECVKDFGMVSVWSLKQGGYAICTLTSSNTFKVYSLENQIEFAINNAIWLEEIL